MHSIPSSPLAFALTFCLCRLQRKAALISLASTMATTRWCKAQNLRRWSSSVTTLMLSAVMPGVSASQMVPGVANNPSVSEVPPSVYILTP